LQYRIEADLRKSEYLEVSKAAIRKSSAQVGDDYVELARTLVVERLGKSQFLLTENELSKVLGLARMTIYRQREAGKLSHFRVGKRIMYSVIHLGAFLQAHEERAR
jgi:hypothetical protein